MTTEELIKALREKTSRDNRDLLDEAAARLEELNGYRTPKRIDLMLAPSVGKVAVICPTCGFDTFGDNEDKYCCYCGQALDWEE